MRGADTFKNVPRSWKRSGFDSESIRARYLLRKMRKFQLKQKFNVEPLWKHDDSRLELDPCKLSLTINLYSQNLHFECLTK